MAEALLDHQGIGGLHTVDDTQEVDVENPVPIAGAHILGFASDNNTRIVEDKVEPAVLVGCGVDEFFYG